MPQDDVFAGVRVLQLFHQQRHLERGRYLLSVQKLRFNSTLFSAFTSHLLFEGLGHKILYLSIGLLWFDYLRLRFNLQRLVQFLLELHQRFTTLKYIQRYARSPHLCFQFPFLQFSLNCIHRHYFFATTDLINILGQHVQGRQHKRIVLLLVNELLLQKSIAIHTQTEPKQRLDKQTVQFPLLLPLHHNLPKGPGNELETKLRDQQQQVLKMKLRVDMSMPHLPLIVLLELPVVPQQRVLLRKVNEQRKASPEQKEEGGSGETFRQREQRLNGESEFEL